MRIRTTIALGVLGMAVAALPATAQPLALPGEGSAVLRALRAPIAGALPSPASPASASPAAAQQPAPIQPPVGSPALLRSIRLEFPTQGNVSVIEPQTYLFYIQTRPSRPSDGVWVAYDEAVEKSVHAQTIKGLFAWGTNPLVMGPDQNFERPAFDKLQWLVCCDLLETETATFWKRPGANPDQSTQRFISSLALHILRRKEALQTADV